MDSCKDNTITIDVYRKTTHTDRYFDFSSHHDKRHKINSAETLLHRAIKLSSTTQGNNTEINHVTETLRVNNYAFYVILRSPLGVSETRTEILVGWLHTLGLNDVDSVDEGEIVWRRLDIIIWDAGR